VADAPRIAVDAMGGDGGPAVMVAGAALARKRSPELRFILFGDQKQVAAEVARHPILKDGVDLVHTDLVIAGTDKASHALRRGRDSSMGRAISAVKAGDAGAAVSAGNTGALMAMAMYQLGIIDGISRPAIATI
jgi:glycerol-3-phosphate acyltransferase PlsX